MRLTPESMVANSPRQIRTADDTIDSMEEQRSAGRQSPWSNDLWGSLGGE